MAHLHAILVGDIVKSRQAGPDATDRAMAVLAEAAQAIAGWQEDGTCFTRFRGDGWQMHLSDPPLCLHATVFIFARLRAARLGLETRIAIGFGSIDRLGTADLSDASGEAFELAGNALDEMPSRSRIALANRQVVEPWHIAVFDLASWIASRWSPEQAEAVALAIAPDETQLTQAEIAERLGITRQAVQARLSGAGWDALGSALEAVVRHDWKEPVP